ncbi:hypothetical protein K438DRAFT_1773307 [Mycena galopus ATCC 62051]|nr:hypothetical protein K438DRAFT_1773307 [Mycena galopus ATCC 62051]
MTATKVANVEREAHAHSAFSEPLRRFWFTGEGYNREVVQKPHKPHTAFWHCAQPHEKLKHLRVYPCKSGAAVRLWPRCCRKSNVKGHLPRFLLAPDAGINTNGIPSTVCKGKLSLNSETDYLADYDPQSFLQNQQEPVIFKNRPESVVDSTRATPDTKFNRRLISSHHDTLMFDTETAREST